MAHNKYIGNENNIVRLQNQAVSDDIKELARSMDVPTQWIFNAVVDAILVGYVYDTRTFWNEVEYQVIANYVKKHE